MGHGSHEVYISQSLRSKVPSSRAAFLMAVTSAWAVGSLLAVTRFTPVATTSPWRVITAPNGPPPLRTLFTERAMALFMKSSFVMVLMFQNVLA